MILHFIALFQKHKNCATFSVLPLIVIWDNGIKRMFKDCVSVTVANK